MIGSYGSNGPMVGGGNVVAPHADEDLAASAGGYIQNPGALINSREAELARRQAGMDRYYDQLARKQNAVSGGTTEESGGKGMGWILPVVLIGGVGVGAFFLLRRKKK